MKVAFTSFGAVSIEGLVQYGYLVSAPSAWEGVSGMAGRDW